MIFLLLLLSPLASFSPPPMTSLQQHIEVIDTETLKHWLEEQKEMILVDARAERYFDGNMLPGAIYLPSNSSQEEILQKLPQKNIPLIVYCGGIDCPASTTLGTRLREMGYQEIYEYAEGIPAWMAAGYPLERAF